MPKRPVIFHRRFFINGKVNYIGSNIIMNWLAQIETELRRIQPGKNPGRTRTIARRVAGFALQQFYQSFTEDFLTLLKQAALDSSLPNDVQHSAQRLSERLSSDFQSPSIDPIGDAKIIVEFVKRTHDKENRK